MQPKIAELLLKHLLLVGLNSCRAVLARRFLEDQRVVAERERNDMLVGEIVLRECRAAIDAGAR